MPYYDHFVSKQTGDNSKHKKSESVTVINKVPWKEGWIMEYVIKFRAQRSMSIYNVWNLNHIFEGSTQNPFCCFSFCSTYSKDTCGLPPKNWSAFAHNNIVKFDDPETIIGPYFIKNNIRFFLVILAIWDLPNLVFRNMKRK